MSIGERGGKWSFSEDRTELKFGSWSSRKVNWFRPEKVFFRAEEKIVPSMVVIRNISALYNCTMSVGRAGGPKERRWRESRNLSS